MHRTQLATFFILPSSATARLFGVVMALLLVLQLSCGGGGGNGDSDKVTLQLDWTPNTNHIGVYVALAKGWYKDVGLDVELLPYTDVSGDTVVANGQADFAIGFPPSMLFSRAAGLDVISVAAVIQRSVSEYAVLDSSEIKRPRDFDGKLYAGFGSPYEEPQIKTVIKHDGGKGEFQTATLSTAAYEALYNKRADFAEIFTAWEGVEAEMRGIKLRTFRLDSYGVPDIYSVVIIAKQSTLGNRADQYARFLDVTRRGYEYAAQNPDDASKVFLEYPPLKNAFPEPEMVRRSTRMLASEFVKSGTRWGAQDAAKWNTFVRYFVDAGVVVDGQGRPVREIPGGPLFTNELLDRIQAAR